MFHISMDFGCVKNFEEFNFKQIMLFGNKTPNITH